MSEERIRLGRVVLLFALLAMSLPGCGTTFREKFHFRAVGEDGNVNYYRVRIKGSAWFSQSQYASGLYDRTAVDALFGELEGARVTVTQGLPVPTGSQNDGQKDGTPKSDDGKPGESTSKSTSTPPRKTLESLDGRPLEDNRFVMFLSSNSNAIVNQIRAFVRNDQLQQSLVTLISRDEIERLEKAKARDQSASAETAQLAARLDALAAELDNATTVTAAETATAITGALTALSNLSSNPSANLPFANANAARTWIGQNPSVFQGEED